MKSSLCRAIALAVSAAFGFLLAESAHAQGSPPTITNQPPASLTNNAGTSVSFTVGATGTAPLSYQWRKNGTALTGATNATLVLLNVLAADQGSYTVVVANSYGPVTSSVARLTVIDPAINQQPYTYDVLGNVVHNDTVVAGDYADFYVDAAGTPPLKYQWKFFRIGGANPVNLSGETNDMMLIPAVQAGDGGTYTVLVTSGSGGKVTSSNLVLTVLVPPTITKQPQSKVVGGVLGNDVTFSVAATGTPPLSYQWSWFTDPIPGATNATLTLANVTPANEGDYHVDVSNAAGSIASDTVTLTVIVPPTIFDQPDGQTVLVGDEYVEFSVDANGTDTLDYPMTYFWRHNGYTLPSATDYVYDIVHNPGTLNEDYAVIEADAGSYSVVVSNYAGAVVSSNAILRVLVPPDISIQPKDRTQDVGTSVTFSVKASGTPPLSYQWFFDRDPFGLSDPNPIPGATSTNLTFLITSTEQAGGYSCVVSNDACSWDVVDTYPADPAESTNAMLVVTVGPFPFIGTQPLSQLAGVGSNVTFNVIAYGTPPLAFQWYYNNTPAGSPASATNVSPYTLTNVQLNQSGNYSVRVSNSYGSVTSSNALLTVILRPTLAMQLVAGRPLLSLNGMLNNSFVVEYSPKLPATNWLKLISITNLSSSPYLFPDSAMTTQRVRFYRAYAVRP